MTLKERARAYFTAVSNYDVGAIERMVDENYIQHNPRVPTGRAAFLAMIPKLEKAGSKIKNRRILEDGRHVIMHHQWENAEPFGFERAVAFHIIRFDDHSRIAEHWNVMAGDNATGASLADGAAEIREPHRTEEYKRRAAESLPELVGRTSIEYGRQHQVFGEGNFTLSICEGSVNGVHSVIYDLFGFEDGIVAGRWQIVQEIPKTNLANDNTLFGF